MKTRFYILTRSEAETPVLFYKKLLKLYSLNESRHMSSLVIGIGMFGAVNPSFLDDIIAIFTSESVETKRTSIQAYLENAEWVVDLNTREYDKLVSYHYIFAYCLLGNLIGKQLNEKSFRVWLERRTSSYGVPLGFSPVDQTLTKLTPSQTFASNFYSEVKAFGRIRRRFLLELFAMSNKLGPIGNGCSIVVGLLRGAELTNFTFILTWLITLFPIIFGWNEIARYLPFILRAYDKFYSAQPYSDWIKLLHDPKEVQEFSFGYLSVPFTIAKEIATTYGNSSISFVEGSSYTPQIQEIVEGALMIAKMSGGARTIDTMAARRWRLGNYENRSLIRLLDRGVGAENAIELPDEDINDVEDRLPGGN